MSILRRKGPRPDAVLDYADRHDAVVELYLPTGPAIGSLFHVHGGFWREAHDRVHARPFARAVADAGYVVALPEYRRVGGGGGWPTTCDDVRRALDATAADQRFAARRTVLSGHSAGGHLALWLSANGAGCDLSVAVAPVGDLRAAAASGMGRGAVTGFLGGPGPVDAADPAVLFDTHRPTHPVRIVHGSDDASVEIENSRGLVARHPWIELVELTGVGHFEPVDPDEPAHREVLAAYAD